MPKSWTSYEIEVLKQHFPSEGSKATKCLPGRTAVAIRHKAERLGIKFLCSFQRHRIRNGLEEKECNRCKEWKPLAEFHVCNKHQDGLQHTCRTCKTRYHYDHLLQSKARGHKHYLANRDIIKARARVWEQTAKGKACKKNYSDVHKEKIKAYRAQYYKEHTAKIKAKVKAWNHTQKGRAANQLRKAKRRLTEQKGDLTFADWMQLIQDHSRCPYCGHLFDNGKHKITLDHIIPLSRGGLHIKENVLPVCFTCNVSKHTSLLGEEWLPWEWYDNSRER